MQAVNVGFRENAALSGHFMQLDSLVLQFAQLNRGDLQLGIDLVDHRAGSTRALVVHRGNLFLAPGLVVILEDDNLCVLAPQLDYRIDFGMKLFDRKRNCRDFLHEFRTDLFRDSATSRACHEHAGILTIDANLGFHPFQEL